jgi:hypothetical protein
MVGGRSELRNLLNVIIYMLREQARPSLAGPIILHNQKLSAVHADLVPPPVTQSRGIAFHAPPWEDH